ncbi:hypothetical protein EV363DRAFT_1211238, partial [Boletus edulis]
MMNCQANHTPSKRICVIGAGAASLAVLKYLSQTSYFQSGSWSVIAYESRSKVGGIWCPAPPTDNPPLTPLYDSLTTNLPHPVMGYTEYPFPPSTPLFPVAATVQTYLESYASHFNLIPLIRFNVTVTHATWIRNHWRVTISTGEALEFDNLVVANGHYRLPNVPDIPGLDHWITTNMASHSAWYRRPLEFGRKILVVGGGPSGKDIAAEMRNHVRTVIHSVSGSVSQDDGLFKQRGRPLRFYDDGRVLFEQGIIEENIDHCILATGFQMDLPFFDDDTIRIGNVPLHPPLPPDLYNSRYHIFPLAKYLFPLQSHYPVCSVAFMTLLYRVVPFPIAEAQARAIVRAFADPASLDLEQEADRVLSRSRALIAAGASSPVQLAKAWRVCEAEQWDYRDELFAYAAESGDCPATKVTAWEKEMYANKFILRTAWVELEKENESQRWVEGIGEGGIQEWVEMMYRLLRYARDS